MNIMMVSAESCPLYKTGGLADVVYALSKEVAKKNHNVSIVLPYYEAIKANKNYSFTKTDEFFVSMSWRINKAEIYEGTIDGIKYYLISNPYFDTYDIYNEQTYVERFAFFNLAAKQLIALKKPNIVHVHDWHVGMLPCLMREDKENQKIFSKIKTVFTIHNVLFQGKFDKYILNNCFNLNDELFDNGMVRFDNLVNAMKTGIVYADYITTVSPNYAKELLTPEGGKGMNYVLKDKINLFSGILNGIDTETFNPYKDPFISFNYNSVNYFRTKIMNKRSLFKELNIFEYGGPLYCYISRFDRSKGCELMFPALREILDRKGNIIMLGKGDYNFEQQAEQLRRDYPKQVYVYIGLNEELAHKVYAASDFLIMPSITEACGLSQLIAQRYGTLPIVRNTGGLVDTVRGYEGNNADRADGISFNDYDYFAITNAFVRAEQLWKNIPDRMKVMKNAMRKDNSWTKSAQEYIEIYKNILKVR